MVASNRFIGYIGLSNLTLLTIITICKTYDYCRKEYKSRTFAKVLTFYVLLILTTAVDIPMYIEFILHNNYTLKTYSWHKLETSFLFAALSMTIADWGAVLYDIREYQLYPFLLRRATLMAINFVYAGIALTGFIFCYLSEDLDDFMNSGIYMTCYLLQISISFVLTIFMLNAGLKMSKHLQIAAVRNAKTLVRPSNPNPVNIKTVDARNDEFRNAIWTLNRVMATCAACILLQGTMLIFNYAQGKSGSTSTGEIPTLAYWPCYFWIPLWGTVLSLIFLSRTKKRSRIGEEDGKRGSHTSSNLTAPMDMDTSADGPPFEGVNPLMSPLIGGDDSWGDWCTDDDEDKYTVTCGQETSPASSTRPYSEKYRGILYDQCSTQSSLHSYVYTDTTVTTNLTSDQSNKDTHRPGELSKDSNNRDDFDNVTRTLKGLLSSSFVPPLTDVGARNSSTTSYSSTNDGLGSIPDSHSTSSSVVSCSYRHQIENDYDSNDSDGDGEEKYSLSSLPCRASDLTMDSLQDSYSLSRSARRSVSAADMGRP